MGVLYVHGGVSANWNFAMISGLKSNYSTDSLTQIPSFLLKWSTYRWLKNDFINRVVSVSCYSN